jgi:hypothetical protein
MPEQNQHQQPLTTTLRRYIQAKAAAKSEAQLRCIHDACEEELAELPLLRSALQGTSEAELQLREYQAGASKNFSNHKSFQQIASFSLQAIYGAGDSVAAGQLSASAGHAAPVAARSMRGGAERSNA